MALPGQTGILVWPLPASPQGGAFVLAGVDLGHFALSGLEGGTCDAISRYNVRCEFAVSMSEMRSAMRFFRSIGQTSTGLLVAALAIATLLGRET